MNGLCQHNIIAFLLLLHRIFLLLSSLMLFLLSSCCFSCCCCIFFISFYPSCSSLSVSCWRRVWRREWNRGREKREKSRKRMKILRFSLSWEDVLPSSVFPLFSSLLLSVVVVKVVSAFFIISSRKIQGREGHQNEKRDEDRVASFFMLIILTQSVELLASRIEMGDWEESTTRTQLLHEL